MNSLLNYPKVTHFHRSAYWPCLWKSRTAMQIKDHTPTSNRPSTSHSQFLKSIIHFLTKILGVATISIPSKSSQTSANWDSIIIEHIYYLKFIFAWAFLGSTANQLQSKKSGNRMTTLLQIYHLVGNNQIKRLDILALRSARPRFEKT